MNIKIITVVLLTLMLVTACNAAVEPTETAEPTTTGSPATGGYVKSNLERETSPQVDPGDINALAIDNTAFALSFYDQIRQDDGNIIFSPISISLALSMTMAGAETSTEDAMIEALQLTLTEENIHPAFNALLLAIEESQQETQEDSEGSNFQLNIANSIWGQAGYDFKEAFLDILAENYGAGMYSVDFIKDPETSRNAINDWVEEETEDKIQDLIPPGAIDSLTRLVLANAIYFNGSWLHPFNQSATESAPFTTLGDEEISVEMMKLFEENLLYASGENYQAVNLPYLNTDFVMTILIPDSGAFADVESEMSTESLASLVETMRSEVVNLQMPKFDFETTVNAKDPLAALGMSEAFRAETADFSGITEAEELFITDVLHKATITVDEEGTEAAAATAVIVGIESMPAGDPISLVIDRPFLFLIRHQPTDSILFMGRVLEP